MNFKQRKILKILNYPSKQRYSQLYRHFSEEDKFPYHLKSLLKKGFIKKDGVFYELTIKGISQSQVIDKNTLEIVEPKLPVLILVIKYKNKYLLKKLNKNYGLWPIRTFRGESFEEKIKEKMIKYEFEGEFSVYKVVNIIYHQNNELVYDAIFIGYQLILRTLPKESIKYKLFSIKEIKELKYRDELVDNFLINPTDKTFTKSFNVNI